MNSADVRSFQYAIEQFVNSNTSLPLEVKRIVLKDIYADIAEKANNEIRQQLEERDALTQSQEDNGNA